MDRPANLGDTLNAAKAVLYGEAFGRLVAQIQQGYVRERLGISPGVMVGPDEIISQEALDRVRADSERLIFKMADTAVALVPAVEAIARVAPDIIKHTPAVVEALETIMARER